MKRMKMSDIKVLINPSKAQKDKESMERELQSGELWSSD